MDPYNNPSIIFLMKSVLFLAILGLAWLALAMCAPQMTQEQLDSIRPRMGASCRNNTNKHCCKEVLEDFLPVLEAYQNAVLAGSAEEAIKFFMPNAVASVGAPGTPFSVGTEELLSGFLNPLFEAYYLIPDWSQYRYSVECPDYLTLYGTSPLTFIPKNGDPAFTVPLQVANVFVRNPRHKHHPCEPKWVIPTKFGITLPPA